MCKSRTFLAALASAAVCVCAYAEPAAELSPAPRSGPESGTGWSYERLDLEVDLLDPEKLIVRGEGVLRLDAEESYGPTLALNGQATHLTFDGVTSEPPLDAALNLGVPRLEAVRVADLRRSEPFHAGDRVKVSFACGGPRPAGAQLVVSDDIALASWVEFWYPVPKPGEGRSGSSVAAAPGETALVMPEGWHAVSNGALASGETSDGSTTETWRTEHPCARSFAAGPYTVTTVTIDGRTVGVYRLGEPDEMAGSGDAQAHAVAQAIAAVEARLGPYPYASYGIAEAPDDATDGFYASSEQGLILAKSEVFEYGANLPLFAHEASHGWWGNLVGSGGAGELMCSEALAQ